MNAFMEQFKVSGIESPVIPPCDSNTNTHHECSTSSGECGHCGSGYCGDD